jgi:hypothetical protein
MATLDAEAPTGQAPIQLETLSPVASHDLFSGLHSVTVTLILPPSGTSRI